MVDLKASNEKLRDRATRLVAMLTGLDQATAVELLHKAKGHVKTAVVMHHRQVDVVAAAAILHQYNGRLRPAIESAK